MKNIVLTGAAIMLSTGLALAQSPAANGTNGANSGMNSTTSGTTGMSSNQTAVGTGTNTSTGTNASNGASSGGMSMTQIQHKLAAQGYVHVKDLRHNGKYEMVNAHRYGSYQKSLRIDPTTGRVIDQAKLTDAQVRNMLKAHHYTDIDDVTHHGNMITAKVKKGGQRSKITINARSGAIVSG